MRINRHPAVFLRNPRKFLCNREKPPLNDRKFVQRNIRSSYCSCRTFPDYLCCHPKLKRIFKSEFLRNVPASPKPHKTTHHPSSQFSPKRVCRWMHGFCAAESPSCGPKACSLRLLGYVAAAKGMLDKNWGSGFQGFRVYG